MADYSDQQRGLTRRQLLERSAAAGAAIGAGGLLVDSAAAAGPKPRRGGTLRVALIGGGASTDNLDPWSANGSAELQQAFRQNVFSKLTDLTANGVYENQLAESLEPNSKATVWQITLKKGVTFHDG